MRIDQLLRDAAPDETAIRAHVQRRRPELLRRAMARESHRSKANRTMIGAALLGAALGTGGVAYALDLVPGFIDKSVAEMVPRADERPQMTLIADLTLPDRSRFAAWAGVSKTTACEMSADNWNGEEKSGLGGGGCGDAADYDLNRDRLSWAIGKDRKTYYPVMWGADLTGASRADATRVRITGTFAGTNQPVDETLNLDSATKAYALLLPGTSKDPWKRGFPASGLTLTFLDADGKIVEKLAAPTM
ncbi:MAG: hypothetical protein ACRCYX_10585 [Dermatophilaceae bacterium]